MKSLKFLFGFLLICFSFTPILSTQSEFQQPASFIVFFDGVNYKALNCSTKTIDSTNTDADTVINYALSNLTADRDWKEKVVLQGDFYINNPIQIQNLTILEINGMVKLQNNSNCNLIERYDAVNGNSGSMIIGGLLDGNRGNQSGGTSTGIYWENVNQETNFPNLIINQVSIVACDGVGVELHGDGMYHAHQLRIRSTNSYNLAFYGSDSFFVDCSFGYTNDDNKSNVYIQNSASTHFLGCYFAGELYGSNVIVAGSRRIHFIGCTNADAPKYGYQFIDYDGNYSQQCTIIGGSVIDNGHGTSNTYSGISLEGHTHDCIFSSIWTGNYNRSDQKYGIEEKDSADYNLFMGILGQDNAKAALKLFGANSRCSAVIGGTE